MPYWDYYRPARPKQVKDGVKAKSQRGAFGEKWWSQRWIQVLESFGWENRLQRGRSYARRGQVINLDIEKGKVTSKVQGTQPRPYSVSIKIQQLTEADWEAVLEAMAGQAIFAARLLAGEMPENIEEAFQAAGRALFPGKKDIETDCSCPDWANPCKHIAAVYYLLGERFDEDPFFIFLLRGRSKEEIIGQLRRRRGAVEEAVPEAEAEVMEAASPLQCDGYWGLKAPLEEVRLQPQPVQVEAASLKRLGDLPGWKGRRSFAQQLEPLYAAIRRQAEER